MLPARPVFPVCLAVHTPDVDAGSNRQISEVDDAGTTNGDAVGSQIVLWRFCIRVGQSRAIQCDDAGAVLVQTIGGKAPHKRKRATLHGEVTAKICGNIAAMDPLQHNVSIDRFKAAVGGDADVVVGVAVLPRAADEGIRHLGIDGFEAAALYLKAGAIHVNAHAVRQRQPVLVRDVNVQQGILNVAT